MSDEVRCLWVVPKRASASTTSPQIDEIYGDDADLFDGEAEGGDVVPPPWDPVPQPMVGAQSTASSTRTVPARTVRTRNQFLYDVDREVAGTLPAPCVNGHVLSSGPFAPSMRDKSLWRA